MLTENDLLKAIKECEAEPITPSKISKLADFYTIYDHLFGKPYNFSHSSVLGREDNYIETNGETDFLRAVNGKQAKKVWAVLNELAEVIQTINPRLYDGVIKKLSD